MEIVSDSVLIRGESNTIRELINFIERFCILYPQHKVTLDLLPEQIKNKFADLNQVVMVKSELLTQGFDLKQHIVDIEVHLINAALIKCGGVVSRAAQALGIRRTTLIEKI